MPRRNNRDDGKQRGPNRSSQAAPPAGPLPPVTRAWLAETGQALPTAPCPLDELEPYAAPGAGRYSVNRDSNGTAYHKWRWSAGPLAGRYVMFVADHALGLQDGLWGLLGKIADAEAGRQHATEDRYR